MNKEETKKEIDCDFTVEIVCPFCGHEHCDSWEIQDSQDFECNMCGEEFYLEVNHETTYTSSKKE